MSNYCKYLLGLRLGNNDVICKFIATRMQNVWQDAKKKHALLLICQVNREKKMFQGIKKKYKLISKRMKKSACIFLFP